MRLAFVVTNFNNSFHTRNLVRSFQKSKDNSQSNAQMVVVDNASTAEDRGALEKLDREFPWVDVIYNDENLGYFPGLNVGLDFLAGLPSECDYVIVGNNDLIVDEDFIDTIERNAEQLSQHYVNCPNIINAKGSAQNPHVVSGISPFRWAVWRVYYSSFVASKLVLRAAKILGGLASRDDTTDDKNAQEIAAGYGACYIIDKAFLRGGRRLFMPTFLMHEEFFLSHQLKELGQRPYYIPDIIVHHVEHASVRNVPKRNMWEFERASYAKMCKLQKISKIF